MMFCQEAESEAAAAGDEKHQGWGSVTVHFLFYTVGLIVVLACLRPSLVWWLEKILDPVILKSDA
jgi:hypothetical protein